MTRSQNRLVAGGVFVAAAGLAYLIGENYQALRAQGPLLCLALDLVIGLLAAGVYYLLMRRPAALTSIIEEKDRQLRRMARYDPVTGLCNRRQLQTHLSEELARCDAGHAVALLYLDLDRFKMVNGSLGYERGDELLVIVAAILRHNVGPEAILSRIGADEFCVLVPGIGTDTDAAELAGKLLRELQQSFRLDGQRMRISASIGIALAPTDANTPWELMRCADIAMNAAKNNGRNTFQFFTDKLKEHPHTKIKLEIALRQALTNDELQIAFQPLMNMGDLRVVGVETLVRWQHPERGLMLPDSFIPLAEESDLILDMGRWILAAACRQGKVLQQRANYPLRIAVNLSARQLRQRDLPATVARILDETGFTPRLLELEVTESMIMEDMAQAVTILNELKQLGVRISIDDFGTGYSSLSQLKHLPVDTLKVDRSFIRDIHRNADDRSITNAVIAMAHKLHLEVIAEGVENQAQLEILEYNHCDIAQGYWFSKPLPAPALGDLLISSRGFLKGELPPVQYAPL